MMIILLEKYQSYLYFLALFKENWKSNFKTLCVYWDYTIELLFLFKQARVTEALIQIKLRNKVTRSGATTIYF